MDPSAEVNQCRALTPTDPHHLIRLPLKIRGSKFTALLDSGAEKDYVDPHVVDMLKLPTILEPDQKVILANGYEQDGSSVVPMLSYRLGQLKDKRPFTVTQLANYDLILGKPWLSYFNPDIDWVDNTVAVTHKGHTCILSAHDDLCPS
jgi:hypothetical protein